MVSCGKSKLRAETVYQCDVLCLKIDSFLSLNNKCFIYRPASPMFPEQNVVFFHNVTARISVSAINCSRWKHSKLHQTIIKGHGTQSSFLLCFLTAKDAFSYHLSFPFFSSVPFERTPLVSICVCVKWQINTKLPLGPQDTLALCAALTSLFFMGICVN